MDGIFKQCNLMPDLSGQFDRNKRFKIRLKADSRMRIPL
jgi:hypothetical protein